MKKILKMVSKSCSIAYAALTFGFIWSKLYLKFIENKPKEERNVMEMELGEVQEAFANLIWEHEPIRSGELVKLCEKEFNWKKSTTYTVLRKLCEKGLFQNENGIVKSLLSKEAFNASKSEKFVEDTYAGSLPAFIAAFMSHKKISQEEIDEIQKMINRYRED